MIRSCRVPPVLNRICDGKIHSALLVTIDGELLGTSTARGGGGASSSRKKSANAGAASNGGGSVVSDPHAFGTLVADIAVDYARLGEEFAAIDAVQRTRSHLQCLLLELDQGLVGVSSCVGGGGNNPNGIDCFVIAVADRDTPPAHLKSKLQSLAEHIGEALSTLTDGSA